MKRTSQIKPVTKTEALDMITTHLQSHSGQAAFLEKVLSYCRPPPDMAAAPQAKQTLMEIGLTEFESIQLLDFNPKSILCLQLVIEDMDERFSEDDLLRILGLFNSDE